MLYLDGSEELTGYRVKVMRREAFLGDGLHPRRVARSDQDDSPVLGRRSPRWAIGAADTGLIGSTLGAWHGLLGRVLRKAWLAIHDLHRRDRARRFLTVASDGRALYQTDRGQRLALL